MTLTELYTLLKSTGYPVAYSHFNGSPPSIPFITYLEADSTNFFADNRTYKQVKGIQVELYNNKKDPQVEATVEALLDDYELPYETYEIYIESEKLYQKVYQIGVI